MYRVEDDMLQTQNINYTQHVQNGQRVVIGYIYVILIQG